MMLTLITYLIPATTSYITKVQCNHSNIATICVQDKILTSSFDKANAFIFFFYSKNSNISSLPPNQFSEIDNINLLYLWHKTYSRKLGSKQIYWTWQYSNPYFKTLYYTEIFKLYSFNHLGKGCFLVTGSMEMLYLFIRREIYLCQPITGLSHRLTSVCCKIMEHVL